MGYANVCVCVHFYQRPACDPIPSRCYFCCASVAASHRHHTGPRRRLPAACVVACTAGRMLASASSMFAKMLSPGKPGQGATNKGGLSCWCGSVTGGLFAWWRRAGVAVPGACKQLLHSQALPRPRIPPHPFVPVQRMRMPRRRPRCVCCRHADSTAYTATPTHDRVHAPRATPAPLTLSPFSPSHPTGKGGAAAADPAGGIHHHCGTRRAALCGALLRGGARSAEPLPPCRVDAERARGGGAGHGWRGCRVSAALCLVVSRPPLLSLSRQRANFYPHPPARPPPHPPRAARRRASPAQTRQRPPWRRPPLRLASGGR